ncbi:MAG: hypothetical protein BHW12_07745 [Coprobacillus sp. 28_7]|nr:MAG: hypothetical protein BHW12_07745 [Coprobacillus sp. 28_7]
MRDVALNKLLQLIHYSPSKNFEEATVRNVEFISSSKTINLYIVIKKVVPITEILEFNDNLKLTGVILTKLDGDTRGGVALSVRHLTNVPIKFIGVSEKLDGLEGFDPERMAGRILGMGDIVSLVEKATEAITEEEAMDTAKKMQSGKFDLDAHLPTLQ